MKIYLNREYKCVGVDDNTFVANSNTNYIRYYFVDDGAFGIVNSMENAQIFDNTDIDYVTVAFRRSDGNVIQHFTAQKNPVLEEPYFEYIISLTDGVLYRKGALEVSAQFVKATLQSDGYNSRGAWASGSDYVVNDWVTVGTANYRCKADVTNSTTSPATDTTHFVGFTDTIISRKVTAVAINTAHVMDNIGEEAEEYYSQYEQSNNEAHALLQTQITRNTNNIGNLNTLSTDTKTSIVGAINEVDGHADTNASNITSLNNRVGANASLNTTEKTTIVGAINEVDSHADTNASNISAINTRVGANNDLTTDAKTTIVNAINEVDAHANTNAADIDTLEGQMATAQSDITAINTRVGANASLSTQEKATIVGAINEVDTHADQNKADIGNMAGLTEQTLVEGINAAKAIANGKSTSIGLATISAVVSTLNSATSSYLKTGDNVFIVQTGTPDLWVSSVESSSVAYEYTTDNAFITSLETNGYVQVGYYKLSYLETIEGVNTIAWQNISVPTSSWASDTTYDGYSYKATIQLTSFVDYSVIPFATFGVEEANSGNYAPIVKAVQGGVEIYAKSIPTSAITLKTIITFKSQSNTTSVSGMSWSNKGQWVSGGNYKLYDLVYNNKGLYICKENVQSTTQPQLDTTHWDYVYASPDVSSFLTKDNIIQGSNITLTKSGNNITISASSTSDYDDLTDKPITNADLDTITPTSGTYYRHNGASATTYTIGKIYYYNGTEYKALGEQVQANWNETDTTSNAYIQNKPNITIPTNLPQTASNVTTAQLPTDSSQWTSADLGWLQSTLPASRTWNKIAYGNGIYVAVANGDYGAYSTDGITWTQMTMPASRTWRAVCYGNNKFVALARNSQYGAYSTDGITWTQMTLSDGLDWKSVCYGNGKFVAVANSSKYGAYSSDGITWTQMTLPSSADWSGVAYGNGKFVAIPYGSTNGAYSSDGITWTQMTIDAGRGWYNVAYGNGKFVAVAYDTIYGMYSTDGINWNEMEMHTRRLWVDITFGNGKFVAVCVGTGSNYCETSTNGITWSQMAMPLNQTWTSICYGDKFVAIAESSTGAYWNASNDYYKDFTDNSIVSTSDIDLTLNTAHSIVWSKGTGKIRATVSSIPTSAIPFSYKVKQSSGGGQLVVTNGYIPSNPFALGWQSGTFGTTALTEDGLYEIAIMDLSNLGCLGTSLFHLISGQYNYGCVTTRGNYATSSPTLHMYGYYNDATSGVMWCSRQALTCPAGTTLDTVTGYKTSYNGSFIYRKLY